MSKDIQSQTHSYEHNIIEEEKKQEFVGLCTTCKNGPTCMFLNGVSRQILHCEEFQITEEQKIINTIDNSSTPVPTHDIKGLCATCDNLKACSFDKPEGGIWHCEEYL